MEEFRKIRKEGEKQQAGFSEKESLGAGLLIVKSRAYALALDALIDLFLASCSILTANYPEHMKSTPTSEPLHFLLPLPIMLFFQILHTPKSFSTFNSQFKNYPLREVFPHFPVYRSLSFLFPNPCQTRFVVEERQQY